MIGYGSFCFEPALVIEDVRCDCVSGRKVVLFFMRPLGLIGKRWFVVLFKVVLDFSAVEFDLNIASTGRVE